MFHVTPFRCLMIACLFAFATSSMWAQTGSPLKKASDGKTATTQKTQVKKFRGRLPRNYGKIGLLPKQRAAIYGIQEKYHAEIEELEQRLAALKAQEGEEIYAVLDTDQKAALKALEDKRKASSAKTTAATEE